MDSFCDITFGIIDNSHPWKVGMLQTTNSNKWFFLSFLLYCHWSFTMVFFISDLRWQFSSCLYHSNIGYSFSMRRKVCAWKNGLKKMSVRKFQTFFYYNRNRENSIVLELSWFGAHILKQVYMKFLFDYVAIKSLNIHLLRKFLYDNPVYIYIYVRVYVIKLIRCCITYLSCFFFQLIAKSIYIPAPS